MRFNLTKLKYEILKIGRGGRLRNIVEPLNAVVLAVILEKRPNSARSAGESYILVTAVQMKAQPLARMQTLPDQDVLLRQPRFVATGEFQETASSTGRSEVGRPAMNVMLLVKARIIK